MNHAEIVGIDILWYDQLVTLPEMPAENGSAFVEGSSFQGGGKVCSALAAAGRQGIPCKLLAVCGDSRRSRFLVEDQMCIRDRAGAILWITRFSGKLNGAMAATGPMGSLRV